MKTEYLKLWKRPSCYVGATWEGWYVFLGQNRDSDALTRANFDEGLRLVKLAMSANPVPGDADDSATVRTVRESHWAVGWVEWIAIHESDLAALAKADELMGKLEGYPVLNEELWSQYEDEEAQIIWRDCYRVKERVKYIREHKSQFEFQSLSDMLGCVHGKYFAGYASELLN